MVSNQYQRTHIKFMVGSSNCVWFNEDGKK
jgi:hypothetical protein